MNYTRIWKSPGLLLLGTTLLLGDSFCPAAQTKKTTTTTAPARPAPAPAARPAPAPARPTENTGPSAPRTGPTTNSPRPGPTTNGPTTTHNGPSANGPTATHTGPTANGPTTTHNGPSANGPAPKQPEKTFHSPATSGSLQPGAARPTSSHLQQLHNGSAIQRRGDGWINDVHNARGRRHGHPQRSSTAAAKSAYGVLTAAASWRNGGVRDSLSVHLRPPMAGMNSHGAPSTIMAAPTIAIIAGTDSTTYGSMFTRHITITVSASTDGPITRGTTPWSMHGAGGQVPGMATMATTSRPTPFTRAPRHGLPIT